MSATHPNFFCTSGRAEYCDMIGCQGERVWKIKEAENNPFILDEINKTMIINNSGYEGADRYHGRRGDWDLNAGMTVKILNYQHIDNILFAWVEIID